MRFLVVIVSIGLLGVASCRPSATSKSVLLSPNEDLLMIAAKSTIKDKITSDDAKTSDSILKKSETLRQDSGKQPNSPVLAKSAKLTSTPNDADHLNNVVGADDEMVRRAFLLINGEGDHSDFNIENTISIKSQTIQEDGLQSANDGKSIVKSPVSDLNDIDIITAIEDFKKKKKDENDIILQDEEVIIDIISNADEAALQPNEQDLPSFSQNPVMTSEPMSSNLVDVGNQQQYVENSTENMTASPELTTAVAETTTSTTPTESTTLPTTTTTTTQPIIKSTTNSIKTKKRQQKLTPLPIESDLEGPPESIFSPIISEGSVLQPFEIGFLVSPRDDQSRFSFAQEGTKKTHLPLGFKSSRHKMLTIRTPFDIFR